MEDAGVVEPPPPWSPAPAGSAALVFRDLYVGHLPWPSRRHTWTLLRAGRQVVVRFEAQWAKTPFVQIDRASHAAEGWITGARAEFVGEAAPTSRLSVKLTRTVGPDDFGPQSRGRRPVPKTLALDCARRSVQVHPAFATLVAGWKNQDDTMEPASWAPPRVDPVDGALVCTISGATHDETLLLPFTEALVFVAGKKNAKEETAGVEWAFVNSDMVIQQGALRWIPTFAVEP